MKKKGIKIVMILVILFLLVGCSNTSNNSPNQTVINFFDTYKNGNLEEVLQYTNPQTSAELTNVVEGFTESLNNDNLVSIVRDNLSYAIMESTVSEDTAIVKIVVENVNLYTILIEYMNSYMDYIEQELLRGNEIDDEEANIKAQELLQEKINEEKQMFSTSFEIILKKVNNVWLIQSSNDIINAITGNYLNFLHELAFTQHMNEQYFLDQPSDGEEE